MLAVRKKIPDVFCNFLGKNMTRENHLKNNLENDMVISYGYGYNDILFQLFCILVLKKSFILVHIQQHKCQ